MLGRGEGAFSGSEMLGAWEVLGFFWPGPFWRRQGHKSNGSFHQYRDEASASIWKTSHCNICNKFHLLRNNVPCLSSASNFSLEVEGSLYSGLKKASLLVAEQS